MIDIETQILQYEDPVKDPVKLLYENIKHHPFERNCLNDVIKSASEYTIDIDEQSLRTVSKETFKSKVRSAVEKQAFQMLK